jgi:pyruvate/2-oxoglutarate dehydrogenase complex dihydrolipoamide dehydrogenase (E3) component
LRSNALVRIQQPHIAFGRPTKPLTSREIADDRVSAHYGFIKVLVDAETKEILGAAILGIGGDEAVHALLAVMYAKAPYTVVSRQVPIHPTVAELLPTVLQGLQPLG